MEFICHRINSLEELNEIPQEYGVEIDLRDDLKGRIYLHHDPFTPGEYFEEFLKEYNKKGLLILNVKSERVELQALELLKKHEINNFFFLDSSFPMIMQLTQNGISDIALRYSEFEGIDTIKKMSGKVKWIWVDCFYKFPLTKTLYDKIKQYGYKICIVSPELQGRKEDIKTYAFYMKENNILPDAICTKCPNIVTWEQYIKR